MARDGSKISWLPGAATVLAIVSCYGTALLVGLLSILGVSVAVDERAWAGAVSIFAGLATILIGVSARKRRSFGPMLVAAVGFAFILWVLYGVYSRAVEIFGFALLVAATLWDLGAGRSPRDPEGDTSWIEPAELADRLDREPRPVVIDVRGPDEFTGSLGHIAEALNLPLGELEIRLTEINAHKVGPLILVCRTQMRSAKAAAILKGADFRHVRVLRGGMERWTRDGLPVDGRTRLQLG